MGSTIVDKGFIMEDDEEEVLMMGLIIANNG